MVTCWATFIARFGAPAFRSQLEVNPNPNPNPDPDPNPNPNPDQVGITHGSGPTGAFDVMRAAYALFHPNPNPNP